VIRLAGAIVIFFGLDGLWFRTGYYRSLLELESTAGYLANTLTLEQQRPTKGPNEIVAVGDSRIALKPRVANAAGTPYRFFTIAVPGTSPRCWYYMLREDDPTANRYAAIVIPVDTYDDRILEDLRTREVDIHYLTPLLRVGDLFEFAGSYPAWTTRAEAAEAVLFKGLFYRRDLQEFLVNHKRRLTILRDINHRASGWRHDAVWGSASLAGMTVDWEKRVVQPERKQVAEILFQDQPPPNPEFAEYRRMWFGRIIQRYRGSRTRLIFVRLARGPVVRQGLTTDRTSSVREFARRGEIVLLDEHYFDSLERPELFVDALHMNEQGATVFSEMLAREVTRVLGGEQR
jgi:hypothetical protein